jgi:hypothetical protein
LLTREWQKSVTNPDVSCVYVRLREDGQVELMEDETPDAPPVVIPAVNWQRFVEGAKLGQFDLPGLDSEFRRSVEPVQQGAQADA